MIKKALLVVLMLAIPASITAADRVVVLEIATGTWCPNCPSAARGADSMAEEHPGQILIVELHGGNPSDPFITSKTQGRIGYYGITGYPTAKFDGVLEVIGGSYSGNMFFTYNGKYNQRAAVEPPLDIVLAQTPDAFFGSTGTLSATITNTSSGTVSGTVHFTVTESHIPYTWQGMDNLDFVARDLLPDESGEAITLAAGEEKVLERTYDIDTGWPHFTSDENIEFGCFVQGADREIYQGAVLKFGEEPVEGIDEDAPGCAVTVPAVMTDEGSVSLSLDATANVEIRLFDVSGRVAAEVYSGETDPGTREFTVATGNLPRGVYFMSVSIDGVSQTHKTAVLH